MPPTVAGFTTFIRNVMGILPVNLQDNAPVIAMAFAVALEIVNRQLQAVSPTIYNLAVYNLAGDNLINYATDPAGKNYFAKLRASYKITSFIAGVIASSADESTSQTLATPEALKALTLADLQNLHTPYGRAYLGFAQRVGTLWGMT